MFLIDVKILLQIETRDCSQDELLVYLMRQVKQKILNYCNIEEIPASHQHLIADMTALYYKLNYGTPPKTSANSNSNTETATLPTGAVKKEQIGDYTVEYYEASSGFSLGAPDTSKLESVLMDYKSELNQIRKLRM